MDELVKQLVAELEGPARDQAQESLEQMGLGIAETLFDLLASPLSSAVSLRLAHHMAGLDSTFVIALLGRNAEKIPKERADWFGLLVSLIDDPEVVRQTDFPRLQSHLMQASPAAGALAACLMLRTGEEAQVEEVKRLVHMLDGSSRKFLFEAVEGRVPAARRPAPDWGGGEG